MDESIRKKTHLDEFNIEIYGLKFFVNDCRASILVNHRRLHPLWIIRLTSVIFNIVGADYITM